MIVFSLGSGQCQLHISLISCLIPVRKTEVMLSADRVVRVDSEDLPCSTFKIWESRKQASMLSQEKEPAVCLGSCVDSNKQISCTHIYTYWLEDIFEVV